ncbi:MAG: RNA polymerase sigma factor [Methylocystaceae bacterium]
MVCTIEMPVGAGSLRNRGGGRSIEEQELLKKARSGDVLAFEQLVEKYQQKVYSLAFRYMGNEEDASDMSQEAFLKSYKSLRNFKGDSTFGTWLYRITTNVCLDELRRRKRRYQHFNILSIDEPVATSDGDEVEKEIADSAPLQDTIIDRKEFSSYINAMLDQMKPEYRAVIILRDIMDFSYEEIAQVLDCSIGTVKSRINRARNLLKKKMVNQGLF